MMIEEDEPAASGIVERPQSVMDAMLAPDGRHDGAIPLARRRGARVAAMNDEEDAASGFGGEGNGKAPTQRTPPNQMMMIEQPVSSRTRLRTRLSLIGVSPPPAILPPSAKEKGKGKGTLTPIVKTTGRRLTMPFKNEEKGEEKKGGRKMNQDRGKMEDEEKKERKRSADDIPKEIPKKQARVTIPKAATAVLTIKKEVEDTDKNEGEESVTKKKEDGVEKKKSDSSIQLVGHVYRDVNTGRELVVEPETKDVKDRRINTWLEDSFNRTMSDYSSQDDSAGPSTSSASPGTGDFEKDRDVESFEKSLRRGYSTARSRNSNMKMGMVDYSGQRRPSSSNGQSQSKN
ncbi:hypothetical protein PENTCL1PPCAC_23144 [Pristionchus entomophagus]|uniref:Uncharacterized protein n=1 Tax=Pristionchus entomophagus TaxID=358040 RepID=A0AAV5U3H1_9BILA|nr:hypothetical protein PENTCL1PPCAC_23144 [Pristionchus entomophagus]